MKIDDEFARNVRAAKKMLSIPAEIKLVDYLYSEMNKGYKDEKLENIIEFLNDVFEFGLKYESENAVIVFYDCTDMYNYIHCYYTDFDFCIDEKINEKTSLSEDTLMNLNFEFQAYALDAVVNETFKTPEKFKFLKNGAKGITNLRIEKDYISFQFVY